MSDPSNVSQSGTYYIKTNYINSCASNDLVTVVINIYQKVNGERYQLKEAKLDEPLKLTARNIGNQYSWFPGIGLSETSSSNPTFQYNRDIEYTITMKTTNNCIVVDTVLVRVQQPNSIVSDIFVPKAWTPNNDGHNDILKPLPENIQEIKSFRIFNRWGQLVFETKTVGSGWDGIYKGQPQVMDVYTWTLDALGLDGMQFRKSGNSVLIR